MEDCVWGQKEDGVMEILFRLWRDDYREPIEAE